MSDLPTGTVTFLFTDIEGSTTLAQQFPAELPGPPRAASRDPASSHSGA